MLATAAWASAVLGAPQAPASGAASLAVVPEAAGPCLELRRRPTRWSGRNVCLPPGTRVAVTERVRGWVRVAPPEGEGGWVEAGRLDFPAALGGSTVASSAAAAGPETVRQPAGGDVAPASASSEAASEDPSGTPAARPRVRVLPPIGAVQPPPAGARTPPPGTAPPEAVVERSEPAVPAAEKGVAPAPTEAAPPAGAAADQPPAVALGAADLAAIETMVQAWARAWSEQRVDDYLGFYSSAFRPPGGMGRGAWQAERRRRLTGPRRITVEVSSLGVRPVEPGRASVRFTQRYESETYGDRVVKRLELWWEDGGWRILEERVEEQIDR